MSAQAQSGPSECASGVSHDRTSIAIERQTLAAGKGLGSTRVFCGTLPARKSRPKNQERAGACWANSPPIKFCLKPEQQELNFLSTLLGHNADPRHPKRHLHVTTESVA
jgi:hypothetical protein